MNVFKQLFFSALAICFIMFVKTDVKAEMVVYDASGQFLGVADEFPSIYIPWFKKLVRVSTISGDLEYSSTIYFESSDCSGQPYSYANMGFWVFTNDEKYYTGDNIIPFNMELSSYRSSTGRCVVSVYDRYVVPVTQIPPPLILPVELPLSIKIERPHPKKWQRSDIDRDRVPNSEDNCPVIKNQDQVDSDDDGSGDVCDGCPGDPDKTIPGICGCGLSETDTDGDHILDCLDECPDDRWNDKDKDGVCGDVDNCPANYNPDQEDSDEDGIGDVCDFGDPPYYGASLLKLKQNAFYRDTYTKVMNWFSDFSVN